MSIAITRFRLNPEDRPQVVQDQPFEASLSGLCDPSATSSRARVKITVPPSAFSVSPPEVIVDIPANTEEFTTDVRLVISGGTGQVKVTASADGTRGSFLVTVI